MPGYDAFISYSHAADARLAPALQRALQRFAKPWWKLRALNLFRDETSLAAASSLGGALLKALDGARFFILLASPRAAASHWCNEEVAHWLRHRSPDTLLIVLTEGAVAWDQAAGDFDWSRTDALPPALKGALPGEPFWLDLSWARQSEQLSERDPRFQQVVAKLAATLHGRGLEDISGEDVRQHRRTRRVATAAMASIAVLAIGAGLAAWEASRARAVAEANAAEAERQRAAAQKSELEARAQRDAAERALAQTLDATDGLVLEIADGMKDFAGVPRARLRGVLERAEKILDTLPADSDAPAVQRRRMQMSMVFSDALLVLGDTQQALRRATTAMEIARRQSEREPGDRRWQRELSVSLERVGNVQVARGDLATALRAYEASRTISLRLLGEEPDNTRLLHDLSASLLKMGDVQMALGDRAGGLRAYEACREILDRLAQRDPGDVAWQRDLSVILTKLGDVHRAGGDLAAALGAYEASLRIAARLVERDPRNVAWQRDLSVSLEKVGAVQEARGDLPAALRAYEASLKIAVRLAESDPRNAGWQQDLAASWTRVGDIRMAQGDLAGARHAYEASQTIAEGLSGRDTGNAAWQREKALSLNRLGNVQLEQGDLEGALRSHEASARIFERLASAEPANAHAQRDLALSLGKVGDTQVARGDAAAALRAYAAGTTIFERLAQSDAGNADWQFGLFKLLWLKADVMDRMPDQLDQARDAWRRASEIVANLASTNRLAPGLLPLVDGARARLAKAEARLAAGKPKW